MIPLLAALATSMPFADPDFWTLSPQELADRAHDDGDGLHLYAPARVDLAARQTLPVLATRGGPSREPSTHGPVGFFAVELGGEHGYSGWSWTQVGDTPPPSLPTDAQLRRFAATARMRMPEVVDLRAQLLELPWRPMKLRVWAVAAGMVSAPCDITLEGAGEPARPERAPSQATSAAAGKALLEDAGSAGLRITPPKPGLVHVVFVSRAMGFPELTAWRTDGAFVVPHPSGPGWLTVIIDGVASGPMPVRPAAAHPKKPGKR